MSKVLTETIIPALKNKLIGMFATQEELNDTNSELSNLSSQLSTKQNTLVSGTNIKTINGDSLLGAGNLEVSSGVFNKVYDVDYSAYNPSDGVIGNITAPELGTNPVTGMKIIAKMNFGSAYNYVALKLKLNNGTAHQVSTYQLGSGEGNTTTSAFHPYNNYVYELFYDGTQWIAMSVHNVITANNISFTSYSLAEKIVGSWIDGKTIYRKTIVIDNGVANGENNIPHSINNFEHIIKSEMFFYDSSSSSSLLIPCESPSGPHVWNWTINSTHIKLFSGFVYNYPLYITLYYTKTN